jgi:hypothetical protein
MNKTQREQITQNAGMGLSVAKRGQIRQNTGNFLILVSQNDFK